MFSEEINIEDILFIKENSQEYEKTFKVQRIYKPDVVNTSEAITGTATDFLAGFFAANFALSLIFAGLLQYLWSMINTL